MDSSSSPHGTPHDDRTEASTDRSVESLIRRPRRVSSVPRLMMAIACLMEVAAWFAAGYIMYWELPRFRTMFWSLGVELPTSAVRAIQVSDWIVAHWVISAPLILTAIIVPKVVIACRTGSWMLVMACSLVGIAGPFALLAFALGLPRLIGMGAWP